MEINSVYDQHTALVVIDVQNDFADPKGSLYVPGGEDVVPLINAETVRAREAGALVVYTRDWHPESTAHFAKDGGVWPVHCVMGSWGAEFHSDLLVDGPEIRKGSHGEDGYSGFAMRHPGTGEETETEMDTVLQGHGVTRLIVAGLATDYCVKSTALDGLRRGYPVDLLTRAIRAVDLQPGDGARAVEEVLSAGGRAV